MADTKTPKAAPAAAPATTSMTVEHAKFELVDNTAAPAVVETPPSEETVELLAGFSQVNYL